MFAAIFITFSVWVEVRKQIYYKKKVFLKSDKNALVLFCFFYLFLTSIKTLNVLKIAAEIFRRIKYYLQMLLQRNNSCATKKAFNR